MDRRQWLKSSLGLASLGTGLSWLSVGDAFAQSDYKALVCIMLYGGNDGLNTIVPVDAARYGQYSGVRGSLALSKSALVQISDAYALHGSLAPLKTLWDTRVLAPVFNVGPLARPMTKAQYAQWRDLQDASMVPENLFSHSDQQSLWESSAAVSVMPTGWGGRLADAFGGTARLYSTAGNALFVTGDQTQGTTLTDPGEGLTADGLVADPNDKRSVKRRAAFDQLIAGASGNAMQRVYASVQRDAMTISGLLDPILEQAPQGGGADPANPEISAAFNHLNGDSGGTLSRQLYQIAKMIKQRSVVGGGRHVYFASLGGFDTHSGQSWQHASLLQELGMAMSAFYRATVALGVASNVTTFTGSDFGRTFVPNASGGTDHAWGNMHFVMGGAVRGGQTYGVYPSLVPGGADDAGINSWEAQGRWIPTTSVDQYAATLSRWFGLNDVALDQVFPNLVQFGSTRSVGFMAA